MDRMDEKSKERKLAVCILPRLPYQRIGANFPFHRRRERNRTSQRAFRARKEKYTQDLERHYIDLRQRYETLVVLLRKVTGFEAENFLTQNHLDGKLMLTPRKVEV
jgi:hypothetical protein